MTDRPTISEVTAVIRDLRNLVVDGVGDPGDVMDRKADLFERAAAAYPNDAAYAEAAQYAREQADRENGRIR